MNLFTKILETVIGVGGDCASNKSMCSPGGILYLLSYARYYQRIATLCTNTFRHDT